MVTEESPIIRDSVVLSRQWLDLLDQLNIGAFTVDMARRITAINLSARTMMGLEEIELIGRDCTEVFIGVPCLVSCQPENGECSEVEDLHFQNPEDEYDKEFVIRVSTPLYGPDRTVVGCLTLLHDQSPLADLINRIDYEERSLKIILDNLDLGIFTVNRGGHVTFFNKAAEQLTGYDRREVLGKPSFAIFGNDALSALDHRRRGMTNEHRRSSIKAQMTGRDGEKIPVRADYMPLQNEEGRIVGGLATLHDLTLVQQFDAVISERYTFRNMIGRDPCMQRIFEMTRVVAGSDVTVLVEGATGTGKDLLAKVIHSSSRRADKPFVKVNCAAVPENLLESEFFGYVKGAFTGADRNKPGRFQLADGGTIFLDEIGDLPLSLQAKLLRVLEDREFYPLGSRQTVRVDVRIISATNQGLEQLVAARRFREDLYYRLNVMRIELPLLAERRPDIALLIRSILRRLVAVHASPAGRISQEAIEVLLNYDYPGNVRELENILEHALIVCREAAIAPEHLPDYVFKRRLSNGPLRRPAAAAAGRRPDATEGERIRDALRRCEGHRGRAARDLGVDRTTLWRKMKRLGIE